MNKKVLIGLVVIIVIVAGILIWRSSAKPEPMATPPAPPPAPQTLGEEIYQQVQNPGGELPEANPFEAETNPFEKVKTNPFEDVYKNPFGP